MKTIRFCSVLLLSLVFSSLQFTYSQEVEILSSQNGEISATYSPASVGRLIDNNVTTEYTFSGLPNEIVFKAHTTYVVKGISFVSSAQSSDRDPRNIEFAASLDGKDWDILRNVTNLSFAERNQTRTISVSSNQPYQYFRLTIKDATLADGTICSLSEWQVTGEARSLANQPSDARAKAIAYNRVKISWRDLSDDEDAFEIQRSSNGKDYVSITTLPANTVSYIDETVDAASLYFYRVCAVLSRAKSIFSVSNPVTTPEFPSFTLLAKGRNFTVLDQYNNSPAGETVACAFDDDTNTKFLSRNASVWIRIAFSEALVANQYSITSANDSPDRDPKAWRIEGSNNGTTWTALDTKANQTFDKRFQKKFYAFENTTAYQYYRLMITANNGGTLTQLADWLLYGDEEVGDDVINLTKPANFKVDNRAYHYVKLSWDDVANETAYRIERSEDGGNTFTFTYDIPANNTESHPYSLKPETDYVFKLYAVNGDNESEPAVVSVTTGKREFKDKFENYKLWILDQPATFNKVEEIGNTAFYVMDGYSKSDINDLYYEFYAANWQHVFDCYGDELSDSQLHVLLIPMEEGGGLASIYDYRNSASFYRNMVYIKAHKSWFQNRAESGYIYDVMAHELCHIVEGVGGGYNGSMFYPIWGDSKWAEILQYDIFTALGSPRAASWHRDYTEGSNPGGGADYPDKDRKSYWYRDFLYPTYNLYGKTEMLKKFWKLQGQHYRQKNGSFQGNSTNPGGRGNLGELIHFWSAACGVDVKPFAINAFGWNNQFEAWLQQAKLDYPALIYEEAPIDNSYVNICLNQGDISSNFDIRTMTSFIDNNKATYFTINPNTQLPILEITYQSSVLAVVDKYILSTRDNANPKSWKLYASNDNITWNLLDEQTNPSFTANSFTKSLDESSSAYQYYKFEFEFHEGPIKFAEIELWGIQHPSAPHSVKAKRLSESSVYVDWSCEIEEADHYVVERSTDGSHFEQIAEIGKFDISYTDDNLETGEYFYRISVVNKNEQKDRVYSDVAFVNTAYSSLDEIRSTDAGFYTVINTINQYPDNSLSVYSLTGQKVLEMNHVDGSLVNNLNRYLSQGVYILKIDINTSDAGSFSVKGKLKI